MPFTKRGKTHKTPKTRAIIKFLDEIDWMFELNNFEREIILKEYQPENEPNLAAEVKTDTTYKEITISIYPHFFTLDKQQQRKALLHELVHTILSKNHVSALALLKGTLTTESELDEMNEQETTRITHFLDQLFIGNLRYARKAYLNYGK